MREVFSYTGVILVMRTYSLARECDPWWHQSSPHCLFCAVNAKAFLVMITSLMLVNNTRSWQSSLPLAWWLLSVVTGLASHCPARPPGSATGWESESCFWAAAAAPEGRRLQSPLLSSLPCPRRTGSHAAAAARFPAAWKCPCIPGTGRLEEKKTGWQHVHSTILEQSCISFVLMALPSCGH